jgi:hypothetical protein
MCFIFHQCLEFYFCRTLFHEIVFFLKKLIIVFTHYLLLHHKNHDVCSKFHFNHAMLTLLSKKVTDTPCDNEFKKKCIAHNKRTQKYIFAKNHGGILMQNGQQKNLEKSIWYLLIILKFQTRQPLMNHGQALINTLRTGDVNSQELQHLLPEFHHPFIPHVLYINSLKDRWKI